MTGAPIVVELAGLPVGKGRPRFSRATAIAFTPGRTRSYEANLRFAAQQAMGSRPPLGGPLSIDVLAVFPVPASWSRKKRAAAMAGEIRPTTKPDADNLLKITDGLNQVVFVDDKQIVEATLAKVYGERPLLRIEVYKLAKETNQ